MNKKQKKILIRIIAATAMVIGFRFIPLEGYWQLALYMLPYLTVGYDILKKAFKGIIKGQVFDENFLMAVATIGAIVIGEYTEGVAVMLFYQVGELFQSYAVGKSRRSISELMDIRPDYANVYEDGQLVKKDPDEIEVGTTIVVQPGEKIPIDGVVEDGCSALNTSALTGESMPRQAAVGDEVISGCINMTGVLKIRTTREFGESTVSKILDLVENSSSKKSKSEKFISKFARVYTPAVCIAALAVALIPPIVRLLALGLDGDWKTWVYNALTFLVTSCPCAIVISIPLTFFAGIGGAGRDGILIKGSNYLETLSKVKTVVFDKTGTMTQGVFEVSGVHHSSLSDEHLLELAALVESRSTHPIARSIVHASCKYTCGGVCEHGCRHLDLSRVTDVEEIGGNGVVATVNIKGLPFADLIGSAAREGRAAETGTDTEAGTGTGTDAGASKGTDVIRVAVGNEKLMEKVGAAHVHCHMVGTIVHVAIDGAYAGHVVISDVIKPDAKQAIAELKKSGITRTVMLTGDSHKVAQSVAAELGIDEVESELLPADKVTKVEELLDANAAYPGRKLAFVGDGINDAPVLSRADIGIAMGALGSDAAIEAADVVLMDDSPLKISRAIRISRKCLRIVYENIYFAITIKILCLVLVPFGIVGMGAAIFADVGVMVLAVLNAIRALFVKRTAPSKRPVPLKTGQDA